MEQCAKENALNPFFQRIHVGTNPTSACQAQFPLACLLHSSIALRSPRNNANYLQLLRWGVLLNRACCANKFDYKCRTFTPSVTFIIFSVLRELNRWPACVFHLKFLYLYLSLDIVGSKLNFCELSPPWIFLIPNSTVRSLTFVSVRVTAERSFLKCPDLSFSDKGNVFRGLRASGFW